MISIAFEGKYISRSESTYLDLRRHCSLAYSDRKHGEA
jgi:hypothetical protein